MNYLITGATGGLGKEVAMHLARTGVTRLILPARSDSSALSLRKEVRKAGCADVWTPVLDLASLSDVRKFINMYRTQEAPLLLQGLLLNAGTQSAGRLRHTADGIESTFAVNHLAHYALFKGLLRHLRNDAVIGWTASGPQNPSELFARMFGFRGGQYQTAALLALGQYANATSETQACRDAYATSKLCNILVARHLGSSEHGARQYFSFDPGLMPGTGLAREQGSIVSAVWKHVLPRLGALIPGISTPTQSGAVLAGLMTGKLPAPNGSYYNYTGRALEPWFLANEEAVTRDLLHSSDALISSRMQTAKMGHGASQAKSYRPSSKAAPASVQ